MALTGHALASWPCEPSSLKDSQGCFRPVSTVICAQADLHAPARLVQTTSLRAPLSLAQALLPGWCQARGAVAMRNRSKAPPQLLLLVPCSRPAPSLSFTGASIQCSVKCAGGVAPGETEICRRSRLQRTACMLLTTSRPAPLAPTHLPWVWHSLANVPVSKLQRWPPAQPSIATHKRRTCAKATWLPESRSV